jgi:aspartate/methionine/tyrosine aminotransferase
MSGLPEFRLGTYFARWEAASTHHLTASDAETLTVGELLDLGGEHARERFEQLALGYAPSWGTADLREAIASTYDHVGPEHVLAFAGAQEAMFWALQEFVGPGDHAVVTVPNYQAMESLPRAAGAEVDGLVLREDAAWTLDLDELDRLLRPTTRLLAVNFPNNPTGAVPDLTTWRGLVERCDARGIRLFSDEVYRGLELDPRHRLPQAADLSPTAVSLGVMSKSYGLPGLRIGWLACRDRALLERLEQRRHYTTISNSAPSEVLATIALAARDQIWAKNRATIIGNLPVFDEFFSRWGERFEWSAPQGGCVTFPRLRSGECADAFCRRAVEGAGVLLLPGSVYASAAGWVARDRFRIGVGRRHPRPALDALATLVARSAA